MGQETLPGDSIKQVSFEKYRLYIDCSFVIGKGAFGQVYLGHKSTDLQRPLAVKVLKVHKEKEAYFQREFQAIKALQKHKNIVRPSWTYLKSQNHVYLTMDLCDCSLIQVLNKRKTLPQHELLMLFYDVGMGYLHLYKSGVIHNDIKPANVLLKNGTFKLADFGGAHVINVQFHIGTSCTRTYCAPERKKGHDATAQSDIYSIGIMFFECLAGEKPYNPYNHLGTPLNIRHTVNPLFRPYLQKIYDMIKIDPNDRMTIEQFTELVQDLNFVQKMYSRDFFLSFQRPVIPSQVLSKSTSKLSRSSIASMQSLKDGRQTVYLKTSIEMDIKLSGILIERLRLLVLFDRISLQLSQSAKKIHPWVSSKMLLRLAGLCVAMGHRIAQTSCTDDSPQKRQVWLKSFQNNDIFTLLDKCNQFKQNFKVRQSKFEIIKELKSKSLEYLAAMYKKEFMDVMISLQVIVDTDNIRDLAYVLKMADICGQTIHQTYKLDLISQEQIEMLERGEYEELLGKVKEGLQLRKVKCTFAIL